MSRLLETRLPLAIGGTGSEVDVETFNRLVRVLEINLGSVDFTISPHFNSTQISTLQFATGAIIFNTTNQIHQAFDGNALRDLYSHRTYPAGQAINSGLGTVTVNTP